MKFLNKAALVIALMLTTPTVAAEASPPACEAPIAEVVARLEGELQNLNVSIWRVFVTHDEEVMKETYEVLANQGVIFPWTVEGGERTALPTGITVIVGPQYPVAVILFDTNGCYNSGMRTDAGFVGYLPISRFQ